MENLFFKRTELRPEGERCYAVSAHGEKVPD